MDHLIEILTTEDTCDFMAFATFDLVQSAAGVIHEAAGDRLACLVGYMNSGSFREFAYDGGDTSSK